MYYFDCSVGFVWFVCFGTSLKLVMLCGSFACSVRLAEAVAGQQPGGCGGEEVPKTVSKLSTISTGI